jgi:hypothetical protein
MAAVASGSTLHRFVAVLTLLVMGPVLHGAAACSGWSGSASARMACCQAVAGHCAAISSDDCCADAEQRQNAGVVAIALVSPEAETTAGLLLPAQKIRRASALAHRQTTGRPDTYLLDSVFLI